MAIEFDVSSPSSVPYSVIRDALKDFEEISGIPSELFSLSELDNGSISALLDDAVLKPESSWILEALGSKCGIVLNAVNLSDIQGKFTESIIVISAAYIRTPLSYLLAVVVGVHIARFEHSELRDDSGVWFREGKISIESLADSIKVWGVNIKKALPL